MLITVLASRCVQYFLLSIVFDIIKVTFVGRLLHHVYVTKSGKPAPGTVTTVISVNTTGQIYFPYYFKLRFSNVDTRNIYLARYSQAHTATK